MLEALMPVYGRDAGNFSAKLPLIVRVRLRISVTYIYPIMPHLRYQRAQGAMANGSITLSDSGRSNELLRLC